jgi:hypothetical protein
LKVLDEPTVFAVELYAWWPEFPYGFKGVGRLGGMITVLSDARAIARVLNCPAIAQRYE